MVPLLTTPPQIHAGTQLTKIFVCSLGLPLYGFTRNSENVFDIDWTVKVAKDVAMGMAHLHKNNIVHMDLKSKNVLVCEFLLFL